MSWIVLFSLVLFSSDVYGSATQRNFEDMDISESLKNPSLYFELNEDDAYWECNRIASNLVDNPELLPTFISGLGPLQKEQKGEICSHVASMMYYNAEGEYPVKHNLKAAIVCCELLLMGREFEYRSAITRFKRYASKALPILRSLSDENQPPEALQAKRNLIHKILLKKWIKFKEK